MPPTLQIMSGDQAGTEISLTQATVRLGRHPTCEVLIDMNAVSRFHAQLVRENGQYYIEDLNSRNGTFVNGAKIEGKTLLSDNDRVKICDMLLAYRVSAGAGAPPPPPAPPEDDHASTILKTIDASQSPDAMMKVRPEAKLRAVLDISQAIGQSLDQNAIFEKILDSLFRIFPQADRAMLILAEDQEQLRIKSLKLRRPSDETVRFSRTIVRQAMSEKKAILSADAASDERFSMSQSIADFRIRSVMCVPLLAQDQDAMGVIQIDTQSYHQKFEEEDLQILTSVAAQAAVSIENARMHEEILSQERMQRELEFAREVQHGFLPKGTPKIPGYHFWAYYEAAGQVGGDFYDFVSLPEDRLAIFVSDVSGKGVPAALLMAKASSDARVALFQSPHDAARATALMNRAVCDAQLDDRFITMILCIVDLQRNKLSITSAGHMSPIIRRADGSVREPIGDMESGLPIGVLDDFEYVAVETDLEPGDCVVLFSDGISEAMDQSNRLYTIERIREQVAALSPPAEELGEALLHDVKRHADEFRQSDDMTLVVFSRD